MTTSVVDNGVNVEALLGAREALADTPEIAQFQWRSTASWVNGTHSRSSVETFYGFGEEQRHRTTFSYDVDHPLQFAAAGQRRHAGGVRAGRARRLPDRGHRRGGPAAADPAALGAGHHRRRRWTCTASSAPTRTSATASAGSRSSYEIDADATARGDRGAGRAVAEALRGLRHPDQPDQRHRRGQLTVRHREARRCRTRPPWSSGPATAGWP